MDASHDSAEDLAFRLLLGHPDPARAEKLALNMQAHKAVDRMKLRRHGLYDVALDPRIVDFALGPQRDLLILPTGEAEPLAAAFLAVSSYVENLAERVARPGRRRPD